MTGQWGAVELAVEPMHCFWNLIMSLNLCEHYLCMMHSHAQGLFVVHLRPGQGPATMQGWGLPMHSMQQRCVILRLPHQATAAIPAPSATETPARLPPQPVCWQGSEPWVSDCLQHASRRPSTHAVLPLQRHHHPSWIEARLARLL